MIRKLATFAEWKHIWSPDSLIIITVSFSWPEMLPVSKRTLLKNSCLFCYHSNGFMLITGLRGLMRLTFYFCLTASSLIIQTELCYLNKPENVCFMQLWCSQWNHLLFICNFFSRNKSGCEPSQYSYQIWMIVASKNWN